MTYFKRFSTLLVIALFTPLLLCAQVTDAPEDAKAYFISPAHGETVPSTFKVQFGLTGMGIAPAGHDIENTGHHHLLIDVDEMPDFSLPLPASENVIHYGLGQTETVITLSPGEHTLQIVLGDYAHIPHTNPVMSKKITIHVAEEE